MRTWALIESLASPLGSLFLPSTPFTLRQERKPPTLTQSSLDILENVRDGGVPVNLLDCSCSGVNPSYDSVIKFTVQDNICGR